MKPLFPLIITTTILTSCLATKKLSITSASQGIKGYVIENQGNRMPMKGIRQKISKGVACKNCYKTAIIGRFRFYWKVFGGFACGEIFPFYQGGKKILREFI